MAMMRVGLFAAVVAFGVVVSASDNFDDRGDDSTGLGTNWTCASGSDHLNVSSHTAVTNASAAHNETWCQYTAVTFSADACSEVKVSGMTTGSVQHGPMVRWSGTTYSDATGYVLRARSDGWDIVSYASVENFTQLTSGSTAFADGDTAKLCVVGSSLTGYKNNASIGSVSDSTYATGGIGMFAYDSIGGLAVFDDWNGADASGGGPTPFPVGILAHPRCCKDR